jgi:hypothetical protein
VAQRPLQYFPERQRTAPSAIGLANAEEVVLDTADGLERLGGQHWLADTLILAVQFG